jgi:hypothetical protein
LEQLIARLHRVQKNGAGCAKASLLQMDKNPKEQFFDLETHY